MPFNVLILPFLGGYIFVRFWNYTRYHIMRSDKDRLLIRASLTGLLTLIAAFILKLLFYWFFPCSSYSICLSDWWTKNVPFEYTDISLLAFVIGAVGWYPLNWFFPKEEQINRVIKEDADPFEILLKRARDEGIAVSITMTNDKVYIGLITHQFNPATPTSNIGLLPLQSGFRESDTKKMIFTTFYSQTYEKVIEEIDEVSAKIIDLKAERRELTQNEDSERLVIVNSELNEKIKEWEQLERTSNLFELVIPVNQIASVNFFDSKVHTKYFLPSPDNE